MRLAALCRCGRCGGPRRWSFSAGARAGPPVALTVARAVYLLVSQSYSTLLKLSSSQLSHKCFCSKEGICLRRKRDYVAPHQAAIQHSGKRRATSLPTGNRAPSGAVIFSLSLIHI